MRSFDGVGNFLAQFWKELGDEAIASKALPVLGFEEFFSNNTVRIDEKVSGSRESFLHPGRFGVQHTVSLNRFGIGIRKQRVADVVAVGKELQDFFRVIADGRELQALLLESNDGALQLDQLPFAERSPIRGTEKQKNGAVRSFEAVESLRMAQLIVEGEGRGLPADRETDGHRLDGADSNRVAVEFAAESDRLAEMAGDK